MGSFSGTLGLLSSLINVAPLRIARRSLLNVVGFPLILAAAILKIDLYGKQSTFHLVR